MPSSSSGRPSQRPADVLRQVVVADAAARRCRRAPAGRPRPPSTRRCPAPRDSRRAASSRRHADRLLEPRGVAHGQADRPRALRVDAGAVPLPRRDVPPGLGRRRRPASRPAPGPAPASPYAQHQPAEGRPRLLAGDLLLEHRGHQRLDDPAGARDAQARGGARAPRRAAGGRGSKPAGVVAAAEQVRQRRRPPRRRPAPQACAGAPRAAPRCASRYVAGPVGMQRRPPDGAVVGDPVRRVGRRRGAAATGCGGRRPAAAAATSSARPAATAGGTLTATVCR